MADFRIIPRSGIIGMTSARTEDVVVERVTDTRRLGANGIAFDLILPAASFETNQSSRY